MCVQFCLSVAELYGVDSVPEIQDSSSSEGQSIENGVDNAAASNGLQNPIVEIAEDSNQFSQVNVNDDSGSEADSDENSEGKVGGEGEGKVEDNEGKDGVGEGQGEKGEEGEGIVGVYDSPSILLEEAKVAALKGLNDRSGITTIYFRSTL